jgi:LEA14-like dessication related protein
VNVRRRVARTAAMGMTLALAMAVSGCPLFHTYTQKPKVTLKTVDVKTVDFQGATLAANVQVENRIPVGITVGKVTWNVAIEGNRLLDGVLTTPTVVPPNGTVPVILPFTLKFEDLYRLSQKYKDQDTAPYRLEGTMDIDTPVGPIGVPFSHTGTVPVLKVPEIDLAKVDVRGLSLGGADVRFGFHVRNPNAMELELTALDYTLMLAGASVAEGHLPAALALPAKGSGSFDADVKVSFTQARQAAQSLATKNTADYSIAGSLSAKTPWGAVNTPYTKSGTVKIQR